MDSHEEFLELSAAATAGELNADEQARLDAHLAVCVECRRALTDYEAAGRTAATALAEESEPTKEPAGDTWSVEEAEKAFFKRLDREEKQTRSATSEESRAAGLRLRRRSTFRPSQIRWRDVWMTFAAATILALALGIASYRTGMKQGVDAARAIPASPKESPGSLEVQASDARREQ
jgi:Putative zinc-finger